MPLPANPVDRTFMLRREDKSLVEVHGWETSYTLGIYPLGEGNFASCLLMGGYMLMSGFDSPKQAHEFNKMILAHPRLFTGTAKLDEFFERGGGKSAAWNELVKLRAKAKGGFK